MATISTKLVMFTRFLLLLCSCKLVSTQFTLMPSDIEVNETDEITFSCSYPGAMISWRFEGEDISLTNSHYSISQSDDGSESNVTIVADHDIHTGSYSCLATIQAEIFTSNFTITVYFLDDPTSFGIIIQPDECTSPIVYVGSTVSLVCQAPSGLPMPSVAWFRNGAKIRQGEDDNLDFSSMKRIARISNVQHSHAGEYRCEVTNFIDRRISSTVELTITTPAPQVPRIYLPGDNLSSSHDDELAPDISDGVVPVALGRSFVLTCRIEPPYPVVNQTRVGWTRNGGGLTSGQNNVTLLVLVGRCEYDLIVSSVSMYHEATYRCVYRVGSEPRSQSVSVQIARIRQSYFIGAEINPSPSPPSSSPVIIGVGRGVNFTCSVNMRETPPDGEVSVTLNWLVQREGSNDTFILNSEPGRVFVSPPTVVGVASGQEMQIRVEIREVELADSASYTCNAFNEDNLATPVLNTVTLRVEDQLPISITPSQNTIFLGTSILLTCTLTSDRSGIVFTWFVQNGRVSATSDPRYRITSSQNMSILNITRLELSDVGVVKCMGHDPLHLPVNASTTLIESTSLYIVGNKRRAMVSTEINSTLQLLCPLRGVNMATTQVSWLRENMVVLNGQGVTITRLDNGSSLLTKTNAQLNDEVEYLCQVEQDGVMLELEFDILVTIPGAFISSPPATVNVVEGERVQLDCRVSGRPLPEVNWLFDGKTEIESLRDDNITDLMNGSLLINPVARRHNGSYSCLITGAIQGPDLRMTMLNVTAKTSDSNSGENVLGSLNQVEVILIFTVVGVVLLLLLVAGILMVIVCVAVCPAVVSTSGKYVVNSNKDSPDTADFRRQPSLREKKDNSGILSASPTNDIFDSLQSPQHMTFAYDNGSSGAAIQLNTYGGASASMVSEVIESHDSTPFHHGTMATNSLFSSEEHTSAAALPNFSRNNLSLGDVMGEGEFGPVLMGVASGLVAGQDKTLVAVKVLGHNEEEEEIIDPSLALVEFANQMKLEFPNIACILGMCTEMEPYYIIYEYLDQGDLKKFLLGSRPEQGDPSPLSTQHMHKIILQVANGMAYLFSQRIIHGDLATRNCLVSSDLTVKIADLGIGHDLYNGDYYDNGSQLLPIRWMPPELLIETEEGPSFSLHSDIWSFGVICWEVFSYARLPYDTYNDEEVLSMVPHGSRLRNPSDLCPPETYDVMFDCWNEIPEARPQFAQLYAAILKVEQQLVN